MRKPSSTGLLRFALAILVVVGIVGLIASLPLIRGGEGVELQQLRGLPTLGVEPTLIVWVFGVGSVVLFFIAFLLYRPRAGRPSARGLLPVVFAVSVLIFLSYLVRPVFPAPGEVTDGMGSGEIPGDTGTVDPTKQTKRGESTSAGDGEDTKGEGAGRGKGGEDGAGTTPGEGDAGSGEDGSDTGAGGSSSGGGTNVPGGDPPGPGDGPTGSEEPGPGPGGETGDPEKPGTVLERFLQGSPFVAGVLLLLILFIFLVAIHILRATFRARRALVEAEGTTPPSEIPRGEFLAAIEGIAALKEGIRGDVRSAILASYGHMMTLFRSYGLYPRRHLTVREVEVLAMKSLGLSPRATRELRRLFEEARYSVHPLGDAQRREAIEALRQVGHELAA